jgi:hypothetical protein
MVNPARMCSAVTGFLSFALVAAVFGPAVTHRFINFDDPVYLLENVRVQRGSLPRRFAGP